MSGPLDSAILTYHSIDSSGSVISTGKELFTRQMEAIAGSQYRVVDLAEVTQAPGSLALTFDDGYRNFRTDALPVLERFGFPATVFVVAGKCGTANHWDRDCRSIPQLPLMDWEELCEVAARGVTLGAHTMSHRRLTKLTPPAAEEEILAGRRTIEDRIAAAVERFAYPYGAYNDTVRALAARHYRIGCGTTLKYTFEPLDWMLLPRIDAYYLRPAFGFRIFSAGRAAAYLAFRRLLRQFRTWASR